ncbi:uncharacterized protein LOC111783478 [Cucurbita pepo subsp. pepo]|uniref:uncharacterized protein LOC111783478 n=1 Tax=Cucurbita pepo subsp. pepo TaxID=3664 RepID=UPI000C9D8EB4|nr:uncharacterized protein LOC111783478 [Cucurbita pepo subsp. pepo]
MTGPSLGLRSASYGALDKQLNNVVPPFQTARKPSKMMKEKDYSFPWICKFVHRKKIGMLLLCVVSAAVFLWVLYMGKGEDAQEEQHIQHISMNNSLVMSFRQSPSQDIMDDRSSSLTKRRETSSLASPPPPPPPPSLPPPPPSFPPPAIFMGYTLPPGHPCNNFALPPPPADKKRTGPRPCPVCYPSVEESVALMPNASSDSPVKKLEYIYEENIRRETEFGGSDFGGYLTLAQRTDSFDVRESMRVHCGFVRGVKPGRNTGFDINDDDLHDMEQCRGVVVASAIFGNFDVINQPKNISEYAKNTVCFFMFIDEETEASLKETGIILESSKKIGLWRIVVVHNLPYKDARRTGKIPKLLVHRMFPNARYSLWIDGKLELVVDPYQILARFLWRKNATFAISRHYKRFDVFTEADANKAAGKYDNASIDFQVNFYVMEGLTPYSEAKLPITSDVPEGCVILREHVPISNLFSCLWFNEVDRFTSRDQISFSTVRDKLMAKTNWTLYMFLDCERRNFVIQKYHRDVLEQKAVHPPPPPPSLPSSIVNPVSKLSSEKVPSLPRKASQRRSRERRSRHHRKVIAARDNDLS